MTESLIAMTFPDKARFRLSYYLEIFPDAYSDERIEVEVNLLAFLQAMFTATSPPTELEGSLRKRVAHGSVGS